MRYAANVTMSRCMDLTDHASLARAAMSASSTSALRVRDQDELPHRNASYTVNEAPAANGKDDP